MITIKLVHPAIGVIDEKQSLRCYTKELLQKWRFKYGKKFKECRIEIDGISERRAKNKLKGVSGVGGKNHISQPRVNNY